MTCVTLMFYISLNQVLYRFKEKVEYTEEQQKGFGVSVSVHGTHPPLTLTSSMVQANLSSKPACTATITKTSPNANTNPQLNQGGFSKHTSASTTEQPCPPWLSCPPEIKPCVPSSPSTLRMKPAAGLQER